MKYTQRLVVGVVLCISSIQANQISFDYFGTVTATDIATIIKKYTQSQPATINNYNTIMQEYALLQEAFFVHCGLLFASQVMPGDATNTQTMNIGSILQTALPPEVSALNLVRSLPDTCGLFYNLVRYMRGFGYSISGSVKTVKTRAIDSFYGVIVVNNGWYGSVTEPNNFSSQGGTVTENIYWVKAGINVNNGTDEQTFVKQGTIGIAKATGYFNGGTANNQRIVNFEFTDKDGSTNFTSGNNNQITLTQNNNQSVPFVSVGTNPINLSSIQAVIKATTGLPWALVVEALNVPASGGGYTLEPVLKIRGIVRLNPSDFPLSYQMPTGSFITQPFSAAFLMQGFTLFKQLIESSSQMCTTASWYGSFGNCTDQVLSLTMLSSDKNGMYLQPINLALAKYYGALGYQWGTSSTIEAALNGCNAVIESLFMKKTALALHTMQSVDPLVVMGTTLMKDPNFTAL